MDIEPQLLDDLKSAIDRGQAAGEIITSQQHHEYIRNFRERFGPDALRRLDGEALLKTMHGRRSSDSRCLSYWLEFMNDETFATNAFGGIGGGSALKFGVYQRPTDGEWMGGKGTNPKAITVDDAIQIARRQRDELLAGDKLLAELNSIDCSDEAYGDLQKLMEGAAPELSGDGWAHKYWFLTHSDKLDDYHSPRYQRFHLYKLLQMPPDGVGILDGGAPRFVCAGRFVRIARALNVPVSILTSALNRRTGGFHRFWRIGTTEGSDGDSQWANMRDGNYVSIGWPDSVPDLSPHLSEEKVTLKDRIREWLVPAYSNSGVASRKAGEVVKFVREMAENDLVLACEGQTVLGVGRVSGSYEYERGLRFPHKRPVQWFLLDSWQLPQPEGPRTTVFELGRNGENLLELERKIFSGGVSNSPAIRLHTARTKADTAVTQLPPLDQFAARVDGILRRKGQILLYGPPGTGKTYLAVRAATELAARQRFGKTHSMLTEPERAEIENPNGLVRKCTFHPGYGYEDFIEGLRPETVSGHLFFERRAGIFKQLCADAEKANDRHFFLVVDEINRGDVPRIFGELITLLERDKRGSVVTLPSGSHFSVPSNVFIIGTMNTADRSISLLDVALRRRFGFIELMPDSSLLERRAVGDLPLGPWLDALNARLRRHLKRDARNLQIGHAYLLSQPITSVAELSRVLREDLIPLLEEYCYDDFGALSDILGPGLVDVQGGRIRDEIFDPKNEDSLLQALAYEEMQSLTLVENPEQSDVVDDAAESAADETDDA
ncbi:AAA family ATPase [Bradyrhizobium ottawaense]|uniref:AAA family ATPase n=1 Tax=Bradyrhizobium ottawaense TaxID=931866 RepID=UPI001BA51EE7|nr:AAA family ATPase [Bradyrhizobium ottawaense]MBR1335345.1 AAA family ATPase [Bradyrhizobium ottawaense]WQN83302.1 AAA family ATPase [Bradyrhizobium ottawaense]